MIIDIKNYGSGGSGSGSTVYWNQIVTGGTKIATVTIDDVPTNVFAPEGGQGGSGLELVNYDDIDTAKGQEIYAHPEKYAIQYGTDDTTKSYCFPSIKTDIYAEFVACSTGFDTTQELFRHYLSVVGIDISGHKYFSNKQENESYRIVNSLGEISNPYEGLIVYDKSDSKLKIYKNENWEPFEGGGASFTPGFGVKMNDGELSVDLYGQGSELYARKVGETEYKEVVLDTENPNRQYGFDWVSGNIFNSNTPGVIGGQVTFDSEKNYIDIVDLSNFVGHIRADALIPETLVQGEYIEGGLPIPNCPEGTWNLFINLATYELYLTTGNTLPVTEVESQAFANLEHLKDWNERIVDISSVTFVARDYVNLAERTIAGRDMSPIIFGEGAETTATYGKSAWYEPENYDGYMYYRTDRKQHYFSDGTMWKPVGNYIIVEDLEDVDNPYTGLMAYCNSTIYVHYGEWVPMFNPGQ